MDIRPLTRLYAVSPQISPEDLPAIHDAGFSTIIDNRPDAEIPPDLHEAAIRQAAEAAGFTFVSNPVTGGAITMANVEAQRNAIDMAKGPVLAYCASGNRSSIVWALAMAGRMPTDDLITIPARYGYRLDGLRQDLVALAGRT